MGKMVRRNNLDICAEILKVARGGANKTRIVYKANLNFKLVKKYLDRLTERDLIELSNRYFITTPKGEQFIEKYSSLIHS